MLGIDLLRMLVWTACGAVLLFILMWIDSFFTKYKDLDEIKRGNTAVTTRFVMKLYAQGYILAQSLAVSSDLWTALFVSVASFIILFILEKLVTLLLKNIAGLDLDEGTQNGKVAHALVAGSLHITGALVITSSLSL
ncbi:DUF350 domain-containing protein [Brevibacillus fluminis]|uniref:DUF350 domain-containing protein n=2 Tax=Brevibacillus fluminis TaxID=511487 RepID=A0A3M8D4M6_9BACL|nr:DUF350 domain-containing protein [Brevibacillus fluminis]RNB82793.1 DUF350 domain-containing protein [Brevibacillus fluminis]